MYVVNDGLGRREYFTTRQAAEQYAAERGKFTWATVQTA